MLRTVAAVLLLFALMAPLAAADPEHSGREHDKKCKDSCTEAEAPAEEPAPEPEPTGEEPAPEPTGEQPPQEQPSSGGDSKSKDAPGGIKIIGVGGVPGGAPGALPIPSCEPWFNLDEPSVRPECLLPSNILK